MSYTLIPMDFKRYQCHFNLTTILGFHNDSNDSTTNQISILICTFTNAHWYTRQPTVTPHDSSSSATNPQTENLRNKSKEHHNLKTKGPSFDKLCFFLFFSENRARLIRVTLLSKNIISENRGDGKSFVLVHFLYCYVYYA